MKYFIGPMSKNVVDAVIEFNGDFGFIPSRRQVDCNGGYVNDWTTGEFSKYVNGRVPIQRDHDALQAQLPLACLLEHQDNEQRQLPWF